jgi:N utilization substance protein A
LASIEGFDENLSKELIERAKNFVTKMKTENLSKLKESGFDEYLLKNKFLSIDQLLKLNENNIKTRDQLADLSNFELIEIISDMDKEKADEIIMDSRKHWYQD